MSTRFDFEANDEQPFFFEDEEEVGRSKRSAKPGRPSFGGRASGRFGGKKKRRPRPRLPFFGRGGFSPIAVFPGLFVEPGKEPPKQSPGQDSSPSGAPSPPPESDTPSEGSEFIRWVQNTLNHVMGLNLPVDGVLGVETRSAIRSFQTRQGLPADGIIGPPTEAALIAASGAHPPQAPNSAPESELEWEASEDMELWKTPFELESGYCPRCGLPREEFEFEVGGNLQLTDILISPPSRPGSYGKASNFKNPATTKERCKGGVEKNCPNLVGLEDVSQVSGVNFDYIGGWRDKQKKNHPGIIFSKSAGKWIVVENNRRKNRVHHMLPRAADGLATFIGNMKAINLPVEAILTMGSIYCRCISDTATLSNHSYGDAVDIGGLRFVGGQEVLVANSSDPSDRKLLHRANACLRLSFATVFDYHDKMRHWNHFHCDTNIEHGGERRLGAAWPFVRESLGLPTKGGFDKRAITALKQFAGANAVKDKATLNRTLSKLFIREATRI